MWRAILILALLSGCGGSPSPGPSPTTTEILTWQQPPFFNDCTAMDIHRDVSRWDIFATPYSTFLDNDIVASVVTPDNLSFNLTLLRRYGIVPGPDGKWIALKCIGIDNQASAYSEPIEWTN